jgi:SAM-dependent methyltransferase
LNVDRISGAVRRLVKKSYYLTCASYVVANHLDERRYRKGNIATKSGTLHSTFDPSVSVAYIREVFADFLTYARVEHFSGRVAEIGPGDNCGVAMLMAADGAESVDLVDRFYSARDAERQATIYRALLDDAAVAARFSSADLRDESTFSGLTRYYGPEASAEVFFDEHRGYQFIVSRAVMEHLYDPEQAVAGMARALAPDGILLHKVDLRDHGMFTPVFHPLKFLDVPEAIYARMTRASGRPNRILVHRYRNALDAAGLEYDMLVTCLAGVGDIVPHVRYEEIPQEQRAAAERYVESVRGSFAAPFRVLPAADLAVSGIFFIARRGDARV